MIVKTERNDRMIKNHSNTNTTNNIYTNTDAMKGGLFQTQTQLSKGENMVIVIVYCADVYVCCLCSMFNV